MCKDDYITTLCKTKTIKSIKINLVYGAKSLVYISSYIE